MERDFEDHFGLDYAQLLSTQTLRTYTYDGLFDGAYVRLNGQAAIDIHSRDLQISSLWSRGIPTNVKAAKNPLAHTPDAPEWGDMPLYSYFFTRAVPLILHHQRLQGEAPLHYPHDDRQPDDSTTMLFKTEFHDVCCYSHENSGGPLYSFSTLLAVN
jgi:hypothetical protein